MKFKKVNHSKRLCESNDNFSYKKFSLFINLCLNNKLSSHKLKNNSWKKFFLNVLEL